MSFRATLLSGEEIAKLRRVPKELPGIVGPKDYKPDNSWLEEKQIRACLESKRNYIGTERVEKIQNLSKAEWVSDLNKARVTKKVGKHWEIFGHTINDEDWLLAEEALYLLETCSLELSLYSVPLSVEQSYALLLGGACSLDEYRVYAHLLKRGYRVIRHDDEVKVTRYEKDIVLNQVAEKQKRKAPDENRGSVEGMDVEEKATIMESEDVVFLSESSNISSDVIVLNGSDSEDEKKPPTVKNEFPRRITDWGRNWYLAVNDWIHSHDEIKEIGSGEEKPGFYDISRKTVREILKSCPNVKSGMTLITAPDQRLIPSSIRPRHYQYRINLMNSDQNDAPSPLIRREWARKENVESADEATPVDYPFNVRRTPLGTNPQHVTNSVLSQAHNMQMMAMGMIRSSFQMLANFQRRGSNHSYPQSSRHFSGSHPRMNFRGGANRPWMRGRAFHRRIDRGGRGGGWRFNRKKSRSSLPKKEETKPEVSEIVVVDEEEAVEVDSDPDEIVEMPPPEKKQKIVIIDLDSPPVSPDVTEIVLSEEDCDSQETGKQHAEKFGVIRVRKFSPKATSVEVSEAQKANDVKEEGKTEDSPATANAIDNEKKEASSVGPSTAPGETSPGVIEVLSENDPAALDERTGTHGMTRDDVTEGSVLPEDGLVSDIVSNMKFKDTSPEGDSETLANWEKFKQTPEFTENAARVEVAPLNNTPSCTDFNTLLNRLQIFSPMRPQSTTSIHRLKISFDLYLPNKHFKKSLKQLPAHRVIVMRSSEEMPSFHDVILHKQKFEDGIPFLFAIVLDDALSFFTYDFVDLPVHCDL